jgi:RYK receptor-like tyrosine kinase
MFLRLRIDENFHVKVTDTALSRDLFPNDYHCLGDNENRPIKWMAIESLMRREFSTASDMWSFGVVLWEVTTLALQPFVEVDPFEVGRVLRDGYRLTQPINCPDEL